MKTLLVFGVDRVVGGNVIATLSDRFQVAGVGQNAVKIQGCPTRHADIRDPAQVARQVKKYAPNWVVYAGSLAGSSWGTAEGSLEQEPAIAEALLTAVDEVDAQLTYISTDAVFNSPRMFHDEDSPLADATVSPTPALASAGLAVEAVLQGTSALLVRTHAYGWSPRVEAPEFAELLCQALEDGRPAPIDGQRFASPILATDLAEMLYQAWRAELSGTLHISGAERVSSSRFASQLANTLGLSHPILPDTAGGALVLGSETALVSRLARQTLGTPMPMLAEGLERFVQQAENGYRDRFQTTQEAAYAA